MDLNRFSPSRRSLLLGVGALGLAGCAGLGRASVPGGALLPRTQAVLDRFVAEGRLPGVTVGVRLPDGTRTYLQAGTQDFGPSPAMDRDTLFRIYSMTKPVTGVAAALLIEDGKLALDQPVTDFVPEFSHLTVAVDPETSLEAQPARNVMTVRHLLTHTSGLSYNIAGDGPVQRAYRQAGVFPFTGDLNAGAGDGPRVHDLDEMVRRLGGIPLMFEPGTAYHYSVSLDVLGLVIQRASGMAFPEFLKRRLFDPIGMNDTRFNLAPGEAGRMAALYDYSPPGRRLDPGSSVEAYSRLVTLFAGGAGLVSTTGDYLAFLTTLLEDGRAGRVRVMRPETARLVRTDIMPAGLDSYGNGFGFGGYVARPGAWNAGEYGWDGAAGTKAWLDPVRDYAAVVMVQFFPWGALPISTETRAAIVADLGIQSG
ncbi:serine hydrolase [Brevundimonas sp.]|uniref:serine hydrolase domain-containing protein n=1 Tax=Brevundimonas sp. TaxID=1871086 RepID=UPI002737E862|nr:serine hydrolase domain-containing protein [Brevundimonas sp.]MDP3800614.1 serine hydrolase domain-containing protein [Brevundimonas sp.]